ncbi:MAG: hypothetical protein WA324_07555 [Bryobacteraceae bacterium]
MVATQSDSEHPRPVGLSLLAFSRSLRAAWVVVFALTVASEVYAFPLMAPLPFYVIACSKLLLFLVQGFLAPLAFWRFNALNRGVVLAVCSASLVEGLQGILRHGHAFHWYELLIKLALILAGFVAGLGAVHDREIVIGPLRITLAGRHLGPADFRP